MSAQYECNIYDKNMKHNNKQDLMHDRLSDHSLGPQDIVLPQPLPIWWLPRSTVINIAQWLIK